MASIWDSMRSMALSAKKKLNDKEGLFQQGRFVPPTNNTRIGQTTVGQLKQQFQPKTFLGTMGRAMTGQVKTTQGPITLKQQTYNIFGNRPAAKVIGNTLQTVANLNRTKLQQISGAGSDFYQGGRKIAQGRLFPGAAQVVRGGAKTLSALNPFNYGVDVVSSASFKTPMNDLPRRIATGYSRGVGLNQNISPHVKGRNVNINIPAIGKVSFDPAMTAGQMVGFVNNPVNKKLFQITNTLLPSAGKALLPWLATTGIRGSIEQVLLDMVDMPDKLTEQQKIEWLTKTGLIGAGTEIGGQAIMQGLGQSAKALQLDKVYDSLKEVGRKLNVNVNHWVNGKRISEPLWKVKLREKMTIPGGELESSIKLPNDTGKVVQAPISEVKGKIPLSENPISKSKLATKEAIKQSEALPFEQTLRGGKTELPVQQEVKLPQALGGSSKPIIPKSKKYAYNVNVDKLDLNKPEQQILRKSIDTLKPELEKARGKTLSNKEVVEAAKKSDLLQKVVTKGDSLKTEAQLLKTRQKMVELDKEVAELSKQGNTKQLRSKISELVDQIKVVSSNAAERGRQLQALSIEASEQTLRQKVLKEVLSVEGKSAKVVDAAGKVDWNNANEVYKFYRSFIKPTTGEILDEFRYNNMLSNPRTHLRNAYSNLVQTLVTRPATIAATGDIKGAGKYYVGAIKSLPEAVDNFVKSFKGEVEVKKPDLTYAPTTKLPGVFTWPTRAMEAADKFYSTLIKGGEIARGVDIKKAGDIAEYSLFRQGLKPEGQGKLLNAIDDFTAWTYKAPRAVRWFVPFIRTPMNVLKQWIEYSPAGLATVPGAANGKEQVAKAIVGTIPFVIGGYLAMEDRTTWSAPTDPKEKELFYASGRKPFSIKIGDNWVSMQYLGPFGLAAALPAAYKHYADNSKTSLTDDNIDKMAKSIMGVAEYLSGQTFLDGMNNFVRLFSGDVDYTLPKNLAYTAGQVIPLEGLVRYISTIIDPVYRKSKGFKEEIIKNIPGMSKTLEPYTLPSGEPSTRERRNLLTPFDVTVNKPEYEQDLKLRVEEQQKRTYINEKYESTSAFSSSQLKVLDNYERLKDQPIENVKQELIGLYKSKKMTETEVRNFISLIKAKQNGLPEKEQALIIRGSETKAKYIWEQVKGLSKEERTAKLKEYAQKGLLDRSTLKEIVKLKVGE